MAASVPAFSAKDFLAFERHKWSDPEANAERLLLKRKLHAMGEPLLARLKKKGGDLTLRTSIHNPFTFNGNRVDSLWLYLAPSDKAKKQLRDLLGVSFAAETDTSYVHANLVLEIDFHGVNFGVRVNEKAWWDVANAKKRCEERAGAEEFARRLNAVASGHALRFPPNQASYACGSLHWDAVMNAFRYCEPGKHRIQVGRSLKKDDPALLQPEFLDQVGADLETLLPVYEFLLWSPANDLLLGKRA